ncbi:MAG: histidine phosphatase family protein [Rhodobacteraceae bacterium]|nr:MAG: histidine phosphatase family protein [Paracoccaceae bacterium]
MAGMRRVILLRHAKSSWADPDLADHDRPLNKRGRHAAPLIGAWLADRGFIPDHVICSSSARTVETWGLLRPALRVAPAPEIEPRLYHADPDAMLDLLRGAPDAAQTVMLIGHEPGIGAFAERLSAPGAPPGCARAFAKFPTAAAAVIDLPVSRWAETELGAGRFHAFATPRDLA